MATPSYSPHAVRWCHVCEVGGVDTECPECGEPMVYGHPRSAGMAAEAGMAVTQRQREIEGQDPLTG